MSAPPVITAPDSDGERARRAAIGAAIVDGYTRIPQGEADDAWPSAVIAAMIDDEPW